jgi:hypothetical protein
MVVTTTIGRSSAAAARGVRRGSAASDHDILSYPLQKIFAEKILPIFLRLKIFGAAAASIFIWDICNYFIYVILIPNTFTI